MAKTQKIRDWARIRSGQIPKELNFYSLFRILHVFFVKDRHGIEPRDDFNEHYFRLLDDVQTAFARFEEVQLKLGQESSMAWFATDMLAPIYQEYFDGQSRESCNDKIAELVQNWMFPTLHLQANDLHALLIPEKGFSDDGSNKGAIENATDRTAAVLGYSKEAIYKMRTRNDLNKKNPQPLLAGIDVALVTENFVEYMKRETGGFDK